jgi:tRNA1Val (adenine37-N6)-methyltransferase
MNDDDLTRDLFLGGELTLWQPRRGYRAATDPVLLAAAVPALAGQSVLDLGCGGGTAILCLMRRIAGLHGSGLELQPEYAALARRNAAENRLALEVFEGDVAAMPKALRALHFDHVLTNPPWFGSGTRAGDPGREAANRQAIGLQDWIGAGLRRLKPGGSMTVIHRAESLGHLLAAMTPGCGALQILPLAPREGREAGRVILRGIKGSRAALRLLAPLVLHDGSTHGKDGDDHGAEARAILRDMQPISRFL